MEACQLFQLVGTQPGDACLVPEESGELAGNGASSSKDILGDYAAGLATRVERHRSVAGETHRKFCEFTYDTAGRSASESLTIDYGAPSAKSYTVNAGHNATNQPTN
jgi:hypothetical protein